ncbi:MAG: triose-phosphate isomerase [Candidatus Cyclobacteriaceae bacterium M3_2C_046]
MRKKIVAGNWKMNKTLQEGIELASDIAKKVETDKQDDVIAVLAPPFIHLTDVAKVIRGKKDLYLSAQNCSEHESGAYTGEISAPMVTSTGAQYVILGHSERREYFKESNELLAKKIDIALANGLTPIFCCGEPLEIREKENQQEYVTNQITESLFHLSADDLLKVVVAYEPIWAIGTGKNATSQQAQEMHEQIRAHLTGKYGQQVADEISILYGGSCKPSNAKELFAGADVDGGLIGGASLKADDFMAIINSF